MRRYGIIREDLCIMILVFDKTNSFPSMAGLASNPFKMQVTLMGFRSVPKLVGGLLGIHTHLIFENNLKRRNTGNNLR